MMRDKYMAYEEATAVQSLNWTTVQLDKNMFPSFMGNIRTGIVVGVYASGSSANSIPYYDPIHGSGSAVIGFELYRVGTDNRAPIKQDNYCGVSGYNSGLLTIIGPSIKDGEHWISAIPERLRNVPHLDGSPEWDL